MARIWLSIWCLFWSTGMLTAQQTLHIQAPLKAAIQLKTVQQGFAPDLQYLGNPSAYNQQKFQPTPNPIEHHNQTVVQYTGRSKNTPPAPAVLTGFEAIANASGYPNDNDLAVSNEGKIISVVNSQFHVYDTAGNPLQKVTLDDFAANLGRIGDKFDPRVIFDPIEDKFIAVFLNGDAASNSYVILAFSATNDPLGNWHFYEVAGNQLGDTVWADFPIIALTQQELFVNYSCYKDGGGFSTYIYSGTRVLQIKKSDGYAGKPLDIGYHHSFAFESNLPWLNDYHQMTPVRGGSTLYGPNMFFLTVFDAHAQSDTIYLTEITDTLSSPNHAINTQTLIAPLPYTQVLEAQQPGNHALHTNFNTIQNAILEKGTIQFAKNNANPIDGRAAVYHGFLEDPGGTNQLAAQILSNDSLELAFPTLVYAGTTTSSDAMLIVCDHSSNNHLPGTSVIFYEGGAYSDLVMIKAGESVMDFSFDKAERWGDYTGGQQLYNDPSKIWLSGSFGINQISETWIASVSVAPTVPTGQTEAKPFNQPQLYPNPAVHYFTIELDIAKPGMHQFALYDINGQLVRLLMEEYLRIGLNRFQFNTAPLAPGLYVLEVRDKQGIALSSNKVLVQP